jgi:hypothetical protein
MGGFTTVGQVEWADYPTKVLENIGLMCRDGGIYVSLHTTNLSNEQDYEQLTLFPEDSHASHFPWLESKKVKGTTVTSGRKCSGLSEKLSRLGYLVRTYLESCELPGKQFVRTWSVRDTLSPYLILKLRLSERRTGRDRVFFVAHSRCPLRQGGIIKGTDANEDREGTANITERPNCPSKANVADTEPEQNTSGINPKTGKGAGLSKAVKMWPTPREFMYKDSTTDRNKGNLGEVVGGQLNPTWVEWLQGFPVGWTDIGE